MRTHHLACLALLVSALACRSAIDEEAQQAFRAQLGSASFTVYPAYLHSAPGDGWDQDAAIALAAALVEAGCGEAVASDAHPVAASEPGTNQARMWRESADSFGAWVAAHPPATGYAILPEYLGFSGTREVGGIHVYVVDSTGALVDGLLLNSHHESFRSQPSTAGECTEVLVSVLLDEWSARRR